MTDGAELRVPAPLDKNQTQEAQELALKAFQVLECDGMARVDLFLERSTNQFYLNEVNTIPGFTPISMYPKLWNISGVSYTELISRLIDFAFERAHR